MTGVRVYNGLHGGLPTDAQGLACLPATVLQLTAADIGLPQIGQIDKRHALQIDAQQEKVAGKGQKRTGWKGKKPDGTNGLQRNGPLGGTGKAGEDMTENISVGGQAQLDRLAVERTERAQVAGGGIELQPTPLQPGFVPGNLFAVQRIEGQVFAPTEGRKAVQGVTVCLGRTPTARLGFLSSNGTDETEPGLTRRQAVESRHDVVGGIGKPDGLFFRHNGRELPGKPTDPGNHQPELGLTGRRTDNPDKGSHAIPLVGPDVAIRINGPGNPAMDQLEKQGTFLA